MSVRPMPCSALLFQVCKLSGCGAGDDCSVALASAIGAIVASAPRLPAVAHILPTYPAARSWQQFSLTVRHHPTSVASSTTVFCRGRIVRSSAGSSRDVRVLIMHFCAARDYAARPQLANTGVTGRSNKNPLIQNAMKIIPNTICFHYVSIADFDGSVILVEA